MSFTSLSGCFHFQKSKHYIVGNSICEKKNIYEVINIYLKANCEENRANILLLADNTSLDYILPAVTSGQAKSSNNVACRLEIEEVLTEIVDENSIFFGVYYVDTKNPNIKYYSSFITVGNHIFVEDPLGLAPSMNDIPEEVLETYKQHLENSK